MRALLALLLACGPDDPPGRGRDAPEGPIRFDAVPSALPFDELGQHHATVAFAPDGRAFAAYQLGDWVAGAPFPDGATPGEPLPLSYPAIANHPQVVAGAEGFLMVATSGGAWGLACDWDGVPRGDAVDLGGVSGLYPDVARAASGEGLVVWSDLEELQLASFTGDLASLVALDPLPATLGAVGTPTLRPSGDGFHLAWSDADSLGNGVVRHARLDAAGALLAPPVDLVAVVSDDGDGRASIADGTSGWALAWRDGNDDLATAQSWLRLYDPADVSLVEVALHGDDAARRPSLAAEGDLLVVAWEHAVDGVTSVRLQAWDLAAAEPLGDPVEASLPDGRNHNRPYVALRAEGATVRGLVSWEALERGGGQLRRNVLFRAFEVAL